MSDAFASKVIQSRILSLRTAAQASRWWMGISSERIAESTICSNGCN